VAHCGMAHLRKSREHDSTNGAASGDHSDQDTTVGPIDPRAFGLAKAAYTVGETLDLLSIGRTSLYAAIKRGDLKRVKFGKKTLFYAADPCLVSDKARALERSGCAPRRSRARCIQKYRAKLRSIARVVIAAVRAGRDRR
jgi:hypothetical protein